MNNDSVYRSLIKYKIYSQSILMLPVSFIALNFIAYKFHFCTNTVGHNFWQPFVFLTYKVCGNIGTECCGKKIFICDISFPKTNFEMRNARVQTSVDWSLILAWFQRFRNIGKFIMKNWTWISSSLIFFRDSLKKKLNSQISSFHYWLQFKQFSQQSYPS